MARGPNPVRNLDTCASKEGIVVLQIAPLFQFIHSFCDRAYSGYPFEPFRGLNSETFDNS